MKQWSEIIRNVTMLSQLGLFLRPELADGYISPVFSLVLEVPGQWHINFIFLLTDSRRKRTKRRKIKYRLTDTCNDTETKGRFI